MAKLLREGVYLLRCRMPGCRARIVIQVPKTGFLPTREVAEMAIQRDWTASIAHEDEDYCPVHRAAII